LHCTQKVKFPESFKNEETDLVLEIITSLPYGVDTKILFIEPKKISCDTRYSMKLTQRDEKLKQQSDKIIKLEYTLNIIQEKLSDMHTKEEADEKYAVIGASYTKIEEYNKYAAIQDALNKTYTKADKKYAAISASYTKAEADAKYTATGASYTKAEADATYTQLCFTYKS
jgi:hypothetical protein